MSAYVAMAKVSHKGWVVIPAVLRARCDGRLIGTVSVADADGELYVFPALRDPVGESYGMLGEAADRMARGLIEEHAREVAREEAQIRARR